MVSMRVSAEGPRSFESQRVFAGAKANLYLKVLERRQDGLHNLESLFYPLGAPRDVLTVSPSGSGRGLTLSCNWKELEAEDNILFRTHTLFGEQTGRWPDLDVHLEKQIPMGAGLGGGSSDAAALLKILVGQGGRTFSSQEVMALARKIGSDVPFFMSSTPAWVEGAGERITPVRVDMGHAWLAVACPDVRVPTREAYQAWDAAQNGPGIRGGRDLTGGLFQLRKSLCLTGRCLMNSFEGVVFDLYPDLGDLKKDLLQTGADGVVLSGSGSSLVALCRSQDRLHAVTRYCDKEAITCYVSEAHRAGV